MFLKRVMLPRKYCNTLKSYPEEITAVRYTAYRVKQGSFTELIGIQIILMCESKTQKQFRAVSNEKKYICFSFSTCDVTRRRQ